jgi:DNA-binding response OmpR family regulator
VELSEAPPERLHETSTVDGVAVVRWPDERARADELARRSAPRLLLVAIGEQPPAGNDPLCDWVQEPADELDVQSRIVELRNRASVERPILGDHGVVWRGTVWVPLSPIEARLTAAFLARPGRVLSRQRLEQVGWPEGLPSNRAIDARIKVLRERVGAVGIRIHTVRGQGYLAEIQPPPVQEGAS